MRDAFRLTIKGNTDWWVEWDGQMFRAFKDSPLRLAGHCDTHHNRIVLDARSAPAESARVLVHEHAHALLHEYGYKGNVEAEELVATAMEEIATSMRRSRSYRSVILHGTGGYRDGS